MRCRCSGKSFCRPTMTFDRFVIAAILTIATLVYAGVGVVVYRSVRRDGKSRIRSFLYGMLWLEVLLTFGARTGKAYADTLPNSHPLRRARRGRGS